MKQKGSSLKTSAKLTNFQQDSQTEDKLPILGMEQVITTDSEDIKTVIAEYV